MINKYEPIISIDEAFIQCVHDHVELCKIYEFIDLPDQIRIIEQQNSSILRNYYANALDNNLLEIKTVKYLINKNLRPATLQEKAVEQYQKAEQFINEQLHEQLSLPFLYQLQKIIIEDLYQNNGEINLFSAQPARMPERLSMETEIELDGLFEFLNNDNEFHPIIQSWMLHFRLITLPLFSESKSKFANLMQYFWLRKHKMEMFGLLSIEHEIYINKPEYEELINKVEKGSEVSLNDQIAFGLQLHRIQLSRLKDLFKSYFRKQVDFEKLNARQKNIMNYVFERGYKLKEIDDSILNKRQKLIMYIIQHRGFISTKELVNEFDCNRKTIQRDFTLLLELELVRSIGAGAGLRYCINLHEKGNPQLEKYQADFVKIDNSFTEENFEDEL
ncbi:MAG: DeoR family transcriptional regulator [Bacteroidota bacterium]|nr:DeoR family transcriptional regulator [Bacteroidota bacterium]